MLKRLPDKLEAGRIRHGEFASDPAWGPWGKFVVHGPCGEALVIVASGADHPVSQGWEHVSVSTRRRTPNWTEMCFVKDLFWSKEECVVQFHPPESEYVNNHRFCLHLWRSTVGEFPLPPAVFVGVKEAGEIKTETQAREIRKAFGHV